MILLTEYCYNCGTKRNPHHFFWLVVIDKFDIADAQHSLDPADEKRADRCIQIETCPNCDAEQT